MSDDFPETKDQQFDAANEDSPPEQESAVESEVVADVEADDEKNEGERADELNEQREETEDKAAVAAPESTDTEAVSAPDEAEDEDESQADEPHYAVVGPTGEQEIAADVQVTEVSTDAGEESEEGEVASDESDDAEQDVEDRESSDVAEAEDEDDSQSPDAADEVIDEQTDESASAEEEDADEESFETVEEAEDEAEPEPASKKQWYIVKVQSGREETIKDAIERRVKIDGLEEFFGQIFIPTEQRTDVRRGKSYTRTVKKLPGYVMAEVEFNDRMLYLFRETAGVGDFVGGAIDRPPPPMTREEVARWLGKPLEKGAGKAGPTIVEDAPVSKGERVRVKTGMFDGMEGEVLDILAEKSLVKVELTIFGRPVEAELEYWHVEPID